MSDLLAVSERAANNPLLVEDYLVREDARRAAAPTRPRRRPPAARSSSPPPRRGNAAQGERFYRAIGAALRPVCGASLTFVGIRNGGHDVN